jgi:hypothetical protein
MLDIHESNIDALRNESNSTFKQHRLEDLVPER